MKLPVQAVRHVDFEESEMNTLVVDAAGEVIADCGILGRDTAENEANAARIVMALNAAPNAAWMTAPLRTAYKPGGPL